MCTWCFHVWENICEVDGEKTVVFFENTNENLVLGGSWGVSIYIYLYILQPFDVSLLPLKLDCLFSKSSRSLSEQSWWNAEPEGFFCSIADPCNSARSRTTTSCTLPTIHGCESADSGHVNFTLLLASLIVTIVYKSQRCNCLQDKGNDVCSSKLLMKNETPLLVKKMKRSEKRPEAKPFPQTLREARRASVWK